MWLDFDVSDNRRWTFSAEEALLWIMDSYFSPNSDETAFSLEEATLWVKDSIQVKNMLITDLFLTNTQLFTSQDVN